MKVLNLYAGIGGNRKLWENVEVTAIENDREIAKIYQDFFPDDKVIICDARKYLLNHFEEFEFIWSSPPCQSHTKLRKTLMTERRRNNRRLFPDMNLYGEILFLRHFFKGKWVVENVMGYYEPLIKPQICSKHYFWANFIIGNKKLKNRAVTSNFKKVKEDISGFSLDKYKLKQRKDIILNNCVEPELGLYIFESAFKNKQKTVGDFD